MMMNRISKKKYSWFIPFSLFQIDKKGFKQDLDPEYIHSSIVIAFCSIEQKHDEKAKKNVMEYFEITRHESNKVYIWILLMNPLIWKKKKKKKTAFMLRWIFTIMGGAMVNMYIYLTDKKKGEATRIL